jgi:hypothetical protein
MKISKGKTTKLKELIIDEIIKIGCFEGTCMLSCSPEVARILDNWQEISWFVTNTIKTWRKLRADEIIDFSLKLADLYYEEFKYSEEIEVIKEQITYYTWGSVAISVKGREPVYYPYMAIQLEVFGVGYEDILNELRRQDGYITMVMLVDVIARLEYRLSVDFTKREIEVLKTIVIKRNHLNFGILMFTEVGKIIGISKVQARRYWKNLDKFLDSGIFINYGKLGLMPVLVKQARELTKLERDYTRYSFYDQGNYYSLLFIPWKSRWIEENETEEHFQLLGRIDEMDYGWNLTDFMEKTINRWLNYPGLWKKDAIKGRSTNIKFDENDMILDELRRKDFDILNTISEDIGRLKDMANLLNVSESYISQRISFLSEHSIFCTKVDLVHCGLDYDLFLVLYTEKQQVNDTLQRIKLSLSYFPQRIVFSGDQCLLAKIRIPSKWLKYLLHEVQDLTDPGGEWYENKITSIVHCTRTRSSIKKKLTDLRKLVVMNKKDRNKPLYEWTFEMPRVNNR